MYLNIEMFAAIYICNQAQGQKQLIWDIFDKVIMAQK